MRHHYWEMPIVIYLFLGGLGGGILCWAAIMTQILGPGIDLGEFILTYGYPLSTGAAEPMAEGLFLSVFISIACLAVGCFFLVFELGQPGAMYRVWLNSTSIICWGARLLVVAMVFAIFWWLAYIPYSQLGVLAVLQPFGDFMKFFASFNIIVAGIAGTGIMLYTGIMLSTLKAHSFWATPALPVLFTISALSTACAAIMICAGVCPNGGELIVIEAATEMRHIVHEVDIVLGICEITVLLVMILSFLGAGNTAANQVAHRWIHGSYAIAFWVGMMAFGLVIPLILNIFGSGIATTYIAPILVLAGGFLLRGLCVYSDDRAELPGENRYFNKLVKDAQFMHTWDNIENLY